MGLGGQRTDRERAAVPVARGGGGPVVDGGARVVEPKKRRRVQRKHEFRWRTTEGAQRKRRFATARARDVFARDVVDAKARGVDWQPPREAQACVLADMMAGYLEHSRRVASARTVANRRDALVLFGEWLEAKIGRPDVGAEVLSRRLLEEYDEHLAVHGHRRRYAVTSRRIVIGLLVGFWRWAAERDEWEGLVPMPRRIELPAPVLAGVHAPTFDQVDRMIGELGDEVLRRAAVMQSRLGLRVWQVLRLEREDFDFGARTVTIRGELGKSAREKRGRVLPFPAALWDEMITWELKPGRIITRDVSTVRRAMRAAWEASGVAQVYWRMRPSHAMRKAFRSELRQLGCESDAIEHWCGRRNLGQADDYTDPRTLRLRQIADAIPPIARCAQGAPLLRMLFAPTRMEAA